MNYIVFHRVDNDGKCSGAITKRSVPDAELIGLNYGDDFDEGVFQSGDTVYFVDFGLQPISRMVELEKRGVEIVWIDHHISAIKEAEKVGFDPPGIRQDGIAACELAWGYFNGEDSPMPWPVHWIGRYDVWDHSNPEVIPFMYGVESCDNDPDNQKFWGAMFEANGGEPETCDHYLPSHVFNKGVTIWEYIQKDYKDYASEIAFETEIDGMKAIAVNRGFTGSRIFDSMWDPEKYDLMICFYRTKDKKWGLGFYTEKDDVDVSEIAKKLGGGGHRGASGATISGDLPFKY